MGFALRQMRGAGSVLMAIAASALMACGGPFESGAASWLTATVIDVEVGSEASFEGSGDFQVGPDPGAGVDVHFSLLSEGVASSGEQGTILLYRAGGGIPDVGTHKLAPLLVSEERKEGFTAYFFRQVRGARNESFTATTGELTVNSANEEQVEGSFQVRVVLYCSTPIVDSILNPGPCDPQRPIENGKELFVKGAFSAVRYIPGVPIQDR